MESPYFNPYSPLHIHTRHLPHWEQPKALVFVTWRLADSLPQSLLNTWQNDRATWVARNPPPRDAATELDYRRSFTTHIEDALDSGLGACSLRDPNCAADLEAALLHFDARHYELDSYVVMPNHVHLIVRLTAGHSLPAIVKSWKSFSARAINTRLGTRGSLWQDDYWDRLIRDDSHLNRCRNYIQRNPEKAHLAPTHLRLRIGTTVY